MDATDPTPAPNVLAHLTKVPIAALSPTLEQPEEKCILSNVTLVWPYSSSTRSISLLLSEPDFRLRRSNGQVKVVFHWHVAERIAESHVGIGDSVCLALRGSKWVVNETATQTPGKYVAWDAHFENGVSIEIYRSSKHVSTVHIEPHVPLPSVAEFAPPTTPARISMDPEIDGAPRLGSWGSPAFSKSSRKSFGGALDSAFDPFAEEDGSVPGKGRKRPRFSLRREEWRIVDEPESPREREGTVDWEHELDEEEKVEKEANQVDTNVEPENDIPIPNAVENNHSPELTSYESAPVFAKPSLKLTGSILERRAEQSANTASSGPVNLAEQEESRAAFRLPTDTPHLQPIPSPGLPIPSPLVPNQNHPQGYFSSMSAATQAQDIPSVPEEIRSNTTTHSTILPHLTPPSPLQAADIAAAHVETVHQNPPIDSFELFTHPSASTSFPGHVPAEINGEVPTSFEEEVHSFEPRGDLEMHTADIDMGNADHQMQFPSAAEGVIRRSVEESDQEDGGDNEKNEDDEDEEAEETQGSNMVSMEEEEEEEFGAQDGFQPEVQPQDRPHPTSSPELDEENGDIPEAEDEPRDSEPEAIESPEDKADVSPEVMVPDRSHSLTYSEDESDTGAADEALQYEEASDSASPDDYDNDFQTEAEVPEALSYESEEEHDSLPPPTQHEVIVLDSDSDDELASDQPVTTPSQPPRPQNRPYQEGLSTLSAVAEFAMDGNDEAWSVIGEELDNEGPKSEEEDDDQVHETDTDESSVDELARDHYDFRGREVSAEDQDDDQSMEAKSEEIAANSGGFDLVAETGPRMEAVTDAHSDGEESTWNEEEAHREASLLHQGQHQERWSPESHTEKPGDVADATFGLGGMVDHSLTHSIHAEANFQTSGEQKIPSSSSVAERLEQQVETDHQVDYGLSLDSSGSPPVDRVAHLPSVTSYEQQLLTPDPTQEVALGNQALTDHGKNEPSSMSHTQEPSAGLNISLQTASLSALGATDFVKENVSQPDTPRLTQKEQEDRNDAVPLSESAQIDEEPVSEDISDMIVNDAPQTPTVLITHPPAPDRHAPGLRSKLSYFAPLATLIDHFNTLVDTISIVHEVSPIARATSGPKDYFVTIELTDPSMAGTTLTAQIFRRYKSAIPNLAEGNAILLRNFKVRSFNHAIMLVNVESSAWAVFDGSSPDAEITGPPVEYKSEERAYASGLRRWYDDVGSAMVADNQLQASIERESVDREPTPSSVALSESESLDSVWRGTRGSRRLRRSHRRVTIHELRDGTRYTEVGSPSSKDSIHELRDGTVYANL